MDNLFPRSEAYLVATILVAGVTFGAFTYDDFQKNAARGEIVDNSAMESAEDREAEQPADDFIEESPERVELASIEQPDAARDDHREPEHVTTAENVVKAPSLNQTASEPQNRELAKASPIEPPVQTPSVPERPVDLSSELPEREAELYEQLLASGRKLQNEEGTIPSYSVQMTPQLVRTLGTKALARLVVIDDRSTPKTIFVFPGGDPANPGKPTIAVSADLNGFSSRYIALAPDDGATLVNAVQQRFRQRVPPKAGILLRGDLDAVILAVQKKTAEQCRVQLGEVALTVGRLQMARDLPFSYTVSELITVDRKRIDVTRTARYSFR